MGRHKRQRRKPRKVEKKSSVKKRIEAQKRRETIFGSLIFLGILVAAIAGGWYILQPKSQGDQEHPGVLATDFSLTDIDGNAFRLSDYRGKVVVIDFMATWCGPCRQQMPHFKVILDKYMSNIVLLSIDIDPNESADTLRTFAQEFPYLTEHGCCTMPRECCTWIWARDTANLVQAYEAHSIPKTVIIDQDGYIRFTHTGVTEASTLIEEINQLLS